MLEDFRHCMAFHGSKLANKNGKNHRYIIKIIKTIPHDSTKIQQISINVPYILWLLLDSSGLACRSAGGLDPLHRNDGAVWGRGMGRFFGDFEDWASHFFLHLEDWSSHYCLCFFVEGWEFMSIFPHVILKVGLVK